MKATPPPLSAPRVGSNFLFFISFLFEYAFSFFFFLQKEPTRRSALMSSRALVVFFFLIFQEFWQKEEENFTKYQNNRRRLRYGGGEKKKKRIHQRNDTFRSFCGQRSPGEMELEMTFNPLSTQRQEGGSVTFAEPAATGACLSSQKTLL